MNFLFSTFSLFFILVSGAEDGHRLEVKFSDLRTSTGSVNVCLMNDEGQFLRNCYIGRSYHFNQDEGLRLIFDDLPAGDYAVMAYHDEDGDGNMNRGGLFGLPSEPYAFSNNPSTFFGPPAWRKCLFSVRKDQTISLKF